MAEKIIILSGKQYGGKDTAAKIILENLTNFKRIGLGDAIKIEYSEKTGIPFEEIEKNKHLYRQDLINLGNQRRSEDCDYWIKKVIKTDGNIVVPDVRVKRELDYFEAENAYKIRVNSSRESREKRGKLVGENDVTEVDLDNITTWDRVITNDSTYENLITDTMEVIEDIKRNFLHNH